MAHCPVDGRRGGHGVVKMRSPSEKTRLDVTPSHLRSQRSAIRAKFCHQGEEERGFLVLPVASTAQALHRAADECEGDGVAGFHQEGESFRLIVGPC